MNVKDFNAAYDRTPSISPTTLRMNARHHSNMSRGGINTSMFYPGFIMPDSTTPISSNIPTSTTPGMD